MGPGLTVSMGWVAVGSVGQEAKPVGPGHTVSMGWVSVGPGVCRTGSQACGVGTCHVHGMHVCGIRAL